MWEWVQTSRRTSSRPKPACAEGEVEAAQAALAADAGVEEDDAAVGGDRPDVAVRDPGPGQRQAQSPDAGQDLLGARLLGALAIVRHRPQSSQGRTIPRVRPVKLR